MPVSLTRTSTCEFTRCSRSCTRPSRGVNLTALDSRFQIDLLQAIGIPRDGPDMRLENGFEPHAFGFAPA